MLKAFWEGLGRAGRVGLGLGAAVLAVATVAAAAWLLSSERVVLFSNLAPADAAVMTAELDRMKVAYELGADGTSILVDRPTVHHTRLKLLGKDLPLHGAVGFELFNNSDLGMTEFAQKINYQRALQGEITRTILSLAEVEAARVHLALPEETLFRREASKPKASVTLGLRHGLSLRPEQVNGIQRLIAAAVPGIAVQDVTIVDTRGVALTRPAGSEPLADAGQRFDLKRDIESHLTRKANDVLERTFGPGHALTSVDVTLNLDQVRTTTEDVTAPQVRRGERPTGVIVRERETVREGTPPLATPVRDGGAGAESRASTHRETEYSVGRRVEQVISQPGSIERLQVVAIIQAPLRPGQIEQLRALIGAAVGFSSTRGDVVVVQSLEGLVGGTAGPSGAASEGVKPVPSAAPMAPGLRAAASAASPQQASVIVALAVMLAVIAVTTLLMQWRRSRASAAPVTVPMDEAQRQQALSRLQQWLAEAPSGR